MHAWERVVEGVGGVKGGQGQSNDPPSPGTPVLASLLQLLAPLPGLTCFCWLTPAHLSPCRSPRLRPLALGMLMFLAALVTWPGTSSTPSSILGSHVRA